MSDTPRTDRFCAALQAEGQTIWQALEGIQEWARGLERECASLEANITSTPPEAPASYQRGDRVLVAWQSGHLEECTVDATVVWVKDASGHAHECTLGQISKIEEPQRPQNERP